MLLLDFSQLFPQQRSLWWIYLNPLFINVRLHGEVAEKVYKLWRLSAKLWQLRPQLPEDVDDDGAEVDGGVLQDGDNQGMGLPANGGGVAIEQKPFDERREKVFFKVFAHLRKYFKFNPPSIQGKQTALVNYVIKHFTSVSEGVPYLHLRRLQCFVRFKLYLLSVLWQHLMRIKYKVWSSSIRIWCFASPGLKKTQYRLNKIVNFQTLEYLNLYYLKVHYLGWVFCSNAITTDHTKCFIHESKLLVLLNVIFHLHGSRE